MARIRTIKPEFWSDEKLSECSLSARLLFIGLWTFCDDEGRMDYQPARVRMQVFPCGTVALKKVQELLGELTERSLIKVYMVDGKEYLAVPNFEKHQRINRPTASRLPPAPVPIQGVINGAHGILSESSPLEGKGNGKGYIARKRTPREETEFPEDFVLDDVLRDQALKLAKDCDVDAAFEKFKHHHLARGSRFKNWRSAWNTWIGNFQQFGYPKTIRSNPEAGWR